VATSNVLAKERFTLPADQFPLVAGVALGTVRDRTREAISLLSVRKASTHTRSSMFSLSSRRSFIGLEGGVAGSGVVERS